MDIKDIKTIEDFIKFFRQENILRLCDEYRFFSYDLEPFGLSRLEYDEEDLRDELERIITSIEIDGIRLYFEDLKAYKAFKAKFNLL